MSADAVDTSKRRFLTAATTVVGAVGTAYLLVPFISAWNPSAKARAAGAPVEADISKLEPGQMMTVEWRGKPIWIVHRTEQNLKDLPTLNDQLLDPNSEMPQQPEYCKNEYRSRKPEYLVAVGICTHLGCSPTYRPEIAPADLGPEWTGGYFALATVLVSIWRRAFIRGFLRRKISRSRLTIISLRPAYWLVKMGRLPK